jgi:hypothetical protein
MTAKCHAEFEVVTAVVMKSPASWNTTFSRQHSIIYQKPGLFNQQPITVQHWKRENTLMQRM